MKKLILFLLLAAPAYAQSYDTTAFSSGTNPGATPQTFSLTVASNSNRSLFVGCTTTATGSDSAITAVSYNSDALSAVSGGDVGTSDGTNIRVSAFKMAAPDTGANNVSVTWDANNSGAWVCMAISLYNADQTTLHRTASSLFGATSDGLSTLSPTSVSGDIVLDFIGWRFTGQSPAEGAGQTENACEPSGSPCLGASSRETAAGGTTTMSWTWTMGFTDSSHVAFAIMPVAATGSPKDMMLVGVGR